MKKEQLGEKRAAPEWTGEASQKSFIGWMSAFLVFGLLLLALFILFGYSA